MAEGRSVQVYGLLGFWVPFFAMLIACMHYGYSCSSCGCDLVDSNTATQTQHIAELKDPA